MTTEFQHNFNVFLIYGEQIGRSVAAWAAVVVIFLLGRFIRLWTRLGQIMLLAQEERMEKEKAG